MIKERTKQSRVLACKLRYRHRQNDNVALLDKSIKYKLVIFHSTNQSRHAHVSMTIVLNKASTLTLLCLLYVHNKHEQITQVRFLHDGKATCELSYCSSV